MHPASIEFRAVDGETAGQHLDELGALYTEVYADPPYEWGDEQVAWFTQRFDVSCRSRKPPVFDLLVKE